MPFTLCRQFLEHSTIGLFGAGHLGRAVATGLLAAGLPAENLAICHRGSERTERELAAAGLAARVAHPETVVAQSRILLYLVRPQDRAAIGDWPVREDALFISFMAGVPLAAIPVRLPESQRVRVMTSAPDTLRRRNGIAALFPADSPLAAEILVSLGLRVIGLQRESDIHSFTALGPCLPIALAYWDGLGREISPSEILQTAQDFALPDYAPILHWALATRPTGLAGESLQQYVAQAATPGGVTETIINAIDEGATLSRALARGIRRSQELADG
jgi:pyrroline-5-carboxylate reductase